MPRTQTNPNGEMGRKRLSAAEIHKQPVIRFQVEMLQSRLDRVGLMMAKTGLRTKRELFDYAFTVFEWAIEETAQENTVGSMTPNGVFRSLETPPLKNVQGYEENNKPQNDRLGVKPEAINGAEKTTPNTNQEDNNPGL